MLWQTNMPSCRGAYKLALFDVIVLTAVLSSVVPEHLPSFVERFQAFDNNGTSRETTSAYQLKFDQKFSDSTEAEGSNTANSNNLDKTTSAYDRDVTDTFVNSDNAWRNTEDTVDDSPRYQTRIASSVTSEKINSSDLRPIYIGGLFELSGTRSNSMGYSELTAAKMAVDHVNKQAVLPGFELRLLFNDSKCDPGVGMDALYDLIYRRSQILMVMGSACSEVTKTLAEIVPYWNLILVSFASTSPALSEREKYKTFFRLAPADSSQNAPRAMFIRHFGWNTVAALYESKEVFSLAINEMGSTFEQHNITIVASMSFRQFEDIPIKLAALKEKDARIIIGGFSETAARRVLCEAYRLHMYGPRYVWIMIGDYVERWWELSNDTSCTIDELGHAVEGYFTIDSLNSLSDDDNSTANITLRDFLHDYQLYNGTRPMSPYATSTYDTVWTIALTLSESIKYWRSLPNASEELRLESFSYDSGKAIFERFFDSMQSLSFLGISGPISFEGSDRKGISVIHQNQGGKMKRIALYEPKEEKLDFYCRTCDPIVWLGGRAPRDKYVMVPRQKKIKPIAFYTISCVSVVGLLLAASFLAYNLYHRRLRYIKLSSPKLNNVAVVGCMLVYTGIIILGYDDNSLDEKYYPSICTVRAFLFAAGFSLAFGAMFTKTYRVHQIFTRANRGLIKSKLLRDKQLLIIIGALLVVDSGVVIAWLIVDPMHKQITNLTIEASENDEDLLYIYQLTTCHSNHLEKWTGGLYAYKGLLLIFGVYMAWETRSVKIPALNDSKYIGMNVYNVVIMSSIVVVLSNILSHEPTLAYTVESSFMLLSTTVTLCLLFVPKIYAIVTSEGSPVIAASGITVDANCRRFIVDEKRELVYRAEVQNRVYKSEIVELDQEICRLERLLELPLQPYRKLTHELLCLLPESRVDPEPTTRRRRLQERELCNSISDAGDVCMGVSEDRSDDEHQTPTQLKPPSPRLPLRRRSNRLSIRLATTYAVSKLCKFRPRFSIGNVNYKQDYEDLKGSPSSPEGQNEMEFLAKNRPLHPLLRQKAIEEKRELDILSTIKQSSERSDTKTMESQLSEQDTFDFGSSTNAQYNTTVTFSNDDSVPSHSSGCEINVPLSEYCSQTPKQADPVHCLPNEYDAPPAPRVRRKYGNTLDVPSQVCRITSVDVHDGEPEVSRVRRARSIIESERRWRIKKLQTNLINIQKELQDLDDMEYEVSQV